MQSLQEAAAQASERGAFSLVVVLFAVAALTLIVGGGWYIREKGLFVSGCTAEAMLCPDGKTSVSRTGPNCEFAECPSSGTKCDYSRPDPKYVGKSVDECSRIEFMCEQSTEYFSNECGCGCKSKVNDTSAWKTYRNEKYGFEVKYPLAWSIAPETRQPDGSIRIKFMYPESFAASVPIDIRIFNLKVGEPCGSRDYFHSQLYAGDIVREKFVVAASGVDSWEVLIDHMGAERLFTYLQKEDCVAKHVDKIFRFDNYDAGQENYDKIMSTFRFLQ